MYGRHIRVGKPPRSRALAVAVATSGACLLLAGWSIGDTAAPRPQVVIVKMVNVSPTEYRFEPAEVTVQPGDTVRFEQTGSMPHNVEFREEPAGTDLGGRRVGPYLTEAGETYDVAIDGQFTPGVHRFVCTPHETMGMKGAITVVGGSR